jgi:putative pyruvate formate lyase activating enzyme
MAPRYLELLDSGELSERVEKLNSMLKSCSICPRECAVDRFTGEEGFCKAGAELCISSSHPHFGEEDPLVGSHGSGTIFLTGCNLRCIYCQNYDISHLGVGEAITIKGLSKRMLRLQQIGCHNINFVTPTHFVPQIVEGISLAAADGLKIPIVYNCGGYEKIETLKFLDGIIDIYMPDMKYGNARDAERFSSAKNYPETCFRAITEMHNQVGDLKLDDYGVATSGLLVRHLVLPNGIASSEKIFKFLAEKISKNTYINIMDQYHPDYKAWDFTELSRSPTGQEYKQTVELAKEFGLSKGESFRHISKLKKLIL